VKAILKRWRSGSHEQAVRKKRRGEKENILKPTSGDDIVWKDDGNLNL
jgi:hypothetical protein